MIVLVMVHVHQPHFQLKVVVQVITKAQVMRIPLPFPLWRLTKKQVIPAHSYDLKTCQMIFKAVFGMPKVNRDELVKLNKKRFGVKQDSITSLSLTQLMEVTVKKLIYYKYCTIKDELQKDMSHLKMADIVVHKEISI